MEGEIYNFFRVWITSILSVCYCYGVSKIVPKGLLRLMLILPVVCLFVFLPLNFLSSFHLGSCTSFCISWLANFKLLCLSFDTGPLSDPSLPLIHFIFLACLPIVKVEEPTHKHPQKQEQSQNRTQYANKLRENGPYKESSSTHGTSNNGLRSPSHYVRKVMLLPLLSSVYAYKDYIHPNVVIHIYILYIYIGLEFVLAALGIIAQAMLGIELKQPFNQPYLSTSLSDYWGRRWNFISTNILRSTVFMPIFRYSSTTLGNKLARALSTMVTFVVSALMHELLTYQIFCVWPTWGYTRFFFLHGLLLAVGDGLKDKFTFPWKLPRLIIGLLILGFMMNTFARFVMLDLMRLNVDTKVVGELEVVAEFLIEVAMAWKETFCYLLVCYLKRN